MSELLRLRLRITGRVQGVWYRGATAREATRLGVYGWVRNLSDGSVEAVLEGAPAVVRALAAWCRSGPPGARVAEVVETVEPARGDLQDFRTRY